MIMKGYSTFSFETKHLRSDCCYFLSRRLGVIQERGLWLWLVPVIRRVLDLALIGYRALCMYFIMIWSCLLVSVFVAVNGSINEKVTSQRSSFHGYTAVFVCLLLVPAVIIVPKSFIVSTIRFLETKMELTIVDYSVYGTQWYKETNASIAHRYLRLLRVHCHLILYETLRVRHGLVFWYH